MILSLLLACTVEPEPTSTPPADQPTPSDTPTPPPTEVDTGLDPDGELDVAVLTLGGQFGYDAATGTAVPVTIDGNELPPTFEIQLGIEGWAGSLAAAGDYCTVAYDVTGQPVTLSTDGHWVSVAVGADLPTTSDCVLDAEVWGEDPAETFRPSTFSMAIGPLAEDVREWLEPQLQPGEIDRFHGGVLVADGVIGEPATFVYSNVYQSDAALNVELDETGQLIALEQLAIEAEPPTAWYTLSAGVLWTIE